MFRKLALGALAGAAVLAVSATASQAAFLPIANFGGGGASDTDVTFVSDGVGGGTLTILLTRDISNAAGTNISAATLSLTTNMVADSGAVIGPVTTASFQGGTFSITKGGDTLLSGNFANTGLLSFTSGTYAFSADVSGYWSNGAGAENFVDVFQALHGCLVGDGNLSFAGTAVAPSISLYATGGGFGLNSFTSQLSGNFDANCNVVPEPSEWAAMGLGVLGVGGLMVRARRRTAKA
jgi:hypothetical protein